MDVFPPPNLPACFKVEDVALSPSVHSESLFLPPFSPHPSSPSSEAAFRVSHPAQRLLPATGDAVVLAERSLSQRI